MIYLQCVGKKIAENASVHIGIRMDTDIPRHSYTDPCREILRCDQILERKCEIFRHVYCCLNMILESHLRIFLANSQKMFCKYCVFVTHLILVIVMAISLLLKS